VVTLEENVRKFGVQFFGMTDKRQGIVHVRAKAKTTRFGSESANHPVPLAQVIGPEQGFTLPGTTVVCGDSHTSTHGAFGALAFGIGTSEVEHVLATQTILQKKSQNMRVQIDGDLAPGVTSKDVMLHVIGEIGTAGGTGSVIEFCGTAVEKMSMEARMSMANMSIEGGARAGMFAPDEITFEYLKGKPLAPKGAEWDQAVEFWKSLRSDEGAHYDKVVKINAADIPPTVTWGTSPEDTVSIDGTVPDPAKAADEAAKGKIERALAYMGLEPNQKIQDIRITNVRLQVSFTTAFAKTCTDSGDSLVARLSSVRAPTRVSRTCEQLPPSPRAARSPRVSSPWSSPVPVSSRSRPRRKASTASLSTPVLTGARPVAPCASA
jgi:3-isopropylmalate dehydratase